MLGVLLSGSGTTWIITTTAHPSPRRRELRCRSSIRHLLLLLALSERALFAKTQTPSGAETMCAGDQTITAQTSLSAFSTTWTFGANGSGGAALLFLEPAASGGGGSVSNSSYAK